MNQITLKVKRVHCDAELPEYATGGAACFDLRAFADLESTEWSDHEINHGKTVEVGKPVVFRTGLEFEVPDGWVMLIYSRSGFGFKNNVRLANCVGVIDSDYRGEVMVKLTADSANALSVSPGDRIAQAMLVPCPKVELIEVDELSSTVRGNGGFGHSGVK